METGIQARNVIVELNLGLVNEYARLHFENSDLEYEVFEQEARLGLIRASEKYDPIKGAFSTYAFWWMKQKVKRAEYEHVRLIAVPEHLQQEIAQDKKATGRLEQILGREPNVSEESALTGKAPNKTRELRAMQAEHIVSLDASVSDEQGGVYADSLYRNLVSGTLGISAEQAYFQSQHGIELINTMRRFFSSLDEGERMLAIDYMKGKLRGEKQQVRSLAESHGLEYEPARNIIHLITRRLQTFMRNQGYGLSS